VPADPSEFRRLLAGEGQHNGMQQRAGNRKAEKP